VTEAVPVSQEPVPHITAHPSPTNLLEWHFVLEGAQGSEYEGGVYHGKLVFPPQYPFKPPSISLFTPNGRFATNTKLCLSITDYHPESWNPMWSVGTILTGLLSFMYDTQPTTGSITASKPEKQRLAKLSLGFNVKNAIFRKVFPEWLERHAQQLEEASKLADEQQLDSSTPPAADVRPPLQGTSIITVCVVVVVLAIAVAPFFSTAGRVITPALWSATQPL
jgi:ubiquitin-conjugating enzyme E2 J2